MRHYTHVLGISTSENTSIYALPRGSSFACQQQVVPESSRFARLVHGRIKPSQNGRFARFLLPHLPLGSQQVTAATPKETRGGSLRAIYPQGMSSKRGRLVAANHRKRRHTHNHED